MPKKIPHEGVFGVGHGVLIGVRIEVFRQGSNLQKPEGVPPHAEATLSEKRPGAKTYRGGNSHDKKQGESNETTHQAQKNVDEPFGEARGVGRY